MAKQRATTYRPELAVSRRRFIARPSLVTKQADWYVDPGASVEKQSLERVSLAITNVGLGAAKDVKVHWSFYIADAVARLNDLARSRQSDAVVSIKDGTISLNSSDMGKVTSMWKNQSTTTHDYLLPASAHGDAIHLQIPHAFQLIANCFIALAFRGDGAHSFPELPTLDLSLSYLDIADSRHYAKFRIHVSLAMIADRGESFHAELVPTRAA